MTPLNGQFAGYRQAADYLASHVPADAKVVDLTGWSLFYGQRKGYTFANLIEAKGDFERDAGRGPRLPPQRGRWEYCDQIRKR